MMRVVCNMNELLYFYYCCICMGVEFSSYIGNAIIYVNIFPGIVGLPLVLSAEDEWVYR